MPKKKTHFEQIPVEAVKKIADARPLEKDKPQANIVPLEPTPGKTGPYMRRDALDRNRR